MKQDFADSVGEKEFTSTIHFKHFNMHARFFSTTRLAARYAQTGLQSRVHASKVINSQQKVQLFVTLSHNSMETEGMIGSRDVVYMYSMRYLSAIRMVVKGRLEKRC